MSAARNTPQELALQLLVSSGSAGAIQPGNEDLASADEARPGAFDLALTALAGGKTGEAAERLRHVVELCAEPVAELRAQAQRSNLMSAAAGALALLEQAQSCYRGPDRRGADDRRTGEDRRHLGDSPASEVLERRRGEDRRGGTDRRNPLRDALFKAGNGAWDAQVKAAYELVPLLSMCEFASRAQHALNAFDFWANRDVALMERLSSIDPEWRTAIDDALTPLHLAQCISIARTMAGHLADAIGEVSEQAHEACNGKAEGVGHA